ncbi:ABC transporter permease [Amphibacillus cookii]|uniref:ABC transporter permease n=1 Tax=Amphibacillus cookii TaxID=767787 RepID=UPI00195F1A70|nr:ABC transporter permease [Amphibacillus cookii]MBM7539803.1 ABC-2 type transport system permease protein [Amphibacillus cookii]
MDGFRIVSVLIRNHFKRLKGKWLSLPLVLLAPIILLSVIGYLVIAIVEQPTQQPIHVGIVNLDQTDQTNLLVHVMEEVSKSIDYIDLTSYQESDAEAAIAAEQLDAYLYFPRQFFSSLLRGESVELEVVGHPNKRLEGQLVQGFVDNIGDYIESAQANILTVDYYASTLLAEEERQLLLFEQFQSFFFHALAKDQALQEHEVQISLYHSPLVYFTIAIWFVLITIWLFSLYIILHKNEDRRMKKRMILYGLTDLHEAIALLITLLLIMIVLAISSFALIHYWLPLSLATDQLWFIALLVGLYIFIFSELFILIDYLPLSQRLKLIIQMLAMVGMLLLSGATIPQAYFPVSIQDEVGYLFANHVFTWLEQIILHGRFHAEFALLYGCSLIGIFLMVTGSVIRGRVK